MYAFNSSFEHLILSFLVNHLSLFDLSELSTSLFDPLDFLNHPSLFDPVGHSTRLLEMTVI